MPYPAAHLRLARMLVWLLLSLFLVVASAQELVAIPPLQARVTDLTGTLAPIGSPRWMRSFVPSRNARACRSRC